MVCVLVCGFDLCFGNYYGSMCGDYVVFDVIVC